RAAGAGDHSQSTNDGDYRVGRGAKPARGVRRTDFSNDEAVGFPSDRLDRLGVEAELLRRGAEPGEPVLIGDPDDPVVFDFDPQLDAEAPIGNRGQDERLYPNERRTNVQRREQLAAKREREAEARQARDDEDNS